MKLICIPVVLSLTGVSNVRLDDSIPRATTSSKTPPAAASVRVFQRKHAGVVSIDDIIAHTHALTTYCKLLFTWLEVSEVVSSRLIIREPVALPFREATILLNNDWFTRPVGI